MIGGVFAIVVVKCMFGGLGQNFMNPALGARCFLLIAFAADMTKFTDDMSKYIADGYTSATPLATLRNGGAVNTMDMLIGRTGGTIGETSAIFILTWCDLLNPYGSDRPENTGILHCNICDLHAVIQRSWI